jgi:hypothetical protein
VTEPDERSSDPTPDTDTLRQAWSIVVATARVLVPSTLLASLFFYFGLRYTQDHYLQYGLDESGLGFSTTDYVVRSLNVTVQPARVVAVVVAVAVGLHIGLSAALQVAHRSRPGSDERLARRLGGGLVVVGTVGMLLFWSPGRLDVEPLTSSVGWLVSLATVLYGLYLARKRTRGEGGGVSRLVAEALSDGERRIVGSVLLGTAVVLVVHGAFEVTRAYAHERALQQAMQNEASPWNFPLVRIYSRVDLALDDRLNVDEDLLPGDAGAYRYRYENMRLFLQQNGRVVLWPADRSPRSGMFILHESDEIRIEYLPELR